MRTAVALLLLIGIASVAVQGGYTFYSCDTLSQCQHGTNFCDAHTSVLSYDCIKIDDYAYIEFTSCNFGTFWYRIFPNSRCSLLDPYTFNSMDSGQCTWAKDNYSSSRGHYIQATGCYNNEPEIVGSAFITVFLLYIVIPAGIIAGIVCVIVAVRRRRQAALLASTYYPVAGYSGSGHYRYPVVSPQYPSGPVVIGQIAESQGQPEGGSGLYGAV